MNFVLSQLYTFCQQNIFHIIAGNLRARGEEVELRLCSYTVNWPPSDPTQTITSNERQRFLAKFSFHSQDTLVRFLISIRNSTVDHLRSGRLGTSIY